MPRLFISIVIPAYNEAALLERCVTSLRSQICTEAFEIIVVDNGSTDQTAAIAKRLGVVLLSEPVKGVCAARQAGYEAARGQLIISADADCIYPPGWLERIRRQFRSHPDISGLIGTYRFVDHMFANNLLAAWEQLAVRLHYAFGWQVYVSAANLAFRKESFRGYDVTLKSGGDELYVVKQLRRSGRLAFSLDNPVLTSARRLRKGLFTTLVYDFWLQYLGAYFLQTYGGGLWLLRWRTVKNFFRSFFKMIYFVGSICLIIGLTLYFDGRHSGLPRQQVLLFGVGALSAGFTAYCLFWPTSQLLLPSPWYVRTKQKLVALTFDDGPNQPYTLQIARIIESYGGRASFFQCGLMAGNDMSTTAALARAGHTIGNHSYDHSFLTLWQPARLLGDIKRTTHILERAGAGPIRFIRLPWLAKTPACLLAVKRSGLLHVAGRYVSLREVSQPAGERMAQKCLRKIKPGSIIIMHDSRETTGGDRSETVKAVQMLCASLAADGYRFVSLDELF